MAERERHDPLLKVRADLVRHPRPPPLPDPERLQPPALDPTLEPVVGRAIDPHRPAGRRDVAELLGQREQAQAKSEQHVMLCHPAPFDGCGDPETEPQRRRPRTAVRGRPTSSVYRSHRCCRNLGLVRPRNCRVGDLTAATALSGHESAPGARMSRAGATHADVVTRWGPAGRSAQDQGPLVGRENLAGVLAAWVSSGFDPERPRQDLAKQFEVAFEVRVRPCPRRTWGQSRPRRPIDRRVARREENHLCRQPTAAVLLGDDPMSAPQTAGVGLGARQKAEGIDVSRDQINLRVTPAFRERLERLAKERKTTLAGRAERLSWK
jgi:hypothetical protein